MAVLDIERDQIGPSVRPGYRHTRRPTAGSRPGPDRPGGAPMRHGGTGVMMSRASHRPRPITPTTTVMLALTAAAITVWLGVVAQFGGVGAGAQETPTELAVVHVESGESLQQLAQRVAPEAPVGAVVDRIRELNSLSSVALEAGQTLVAPVG